MLRVQRRLSQRQAKRLRIHPYIPGTLIYREKNGMWSPSLLEHEIEDSLKAFHDDHGHYSTALTLGRMIGQAYWPRRATDVSD